MRIDKIRSLLLIVAIGWTILEPTLATSSETCDYCWGNNHLSNYGEQQKIWMQEAFYFLNCDCCSQGFVSYSQKSTSDQAIDDNETSSHWLIEGNRYYLASSFEQAAISYAEAIKIDPHTSEGRLNMGNALYFLGRYQEALASYDALLEEEPQNVNALKGKSQALLALSRSNEYDRVMESIQALQKRKILQVGSSDNKPVVEPVVVGDFTS